MHRRISQFSRLFALICFTSLAPCLSVSSLEAQDMVARHSLSFPQRNRQYVHVTLQIPVQDGQVELSLPNWTPGSYVIRDHAAHLERLQARDGTGRFLEVEKTAKNRWRIDTEGARELTLNYDVWAGELHVSSSWIESDFALLNGAGIFLFSEDSRLWRQEIVVKLPESWSRIRTSLTALQDKRHFSASNYDELVDSPIVAGNAPEYEFSHDGQNYVLVNQGESGFWDGERSMRDLTAIVKGQQEFWAVNPFDRDYLFLNFLLEGSGGLEHDHSTVMMASRWAMRNEKEYIKWLALVSHEFFHSWNVRRMRPVALAEYDYSKEVYTRELWLAEGLTSYYDNLLLFRAGLIDVASYFELLAEEFRNYETTPGREVRSAELASFDTWIKHYKQDSNNVNSTISYYGKGALIGFVTDMEIRRTTHNRASLDTVMREMYSRYGPQGSAPGGYPPGAFEQVVESVAGLDVRRVVEELLRTTADPDIDAALGWYGLDLARSDGNGASDIKPAGIGVKWSISGAALFAEYVVRGYPAAVAGVLPGDELLAIDKLRVTPETYQARFLKLEEGEEIELTVVRDGRLITLPMVTGPEIPVSYFIQPTTRISNRQKKRMEAWLGRELQFRKSANR